MPPLPCFARRRGAGNRSRRAVAANRARARPWTRTPESGGLDPFAAPPQWPQPAAARDSDVGTTDLRVQDRERESHPDAFVAGTPGARSGGYCAGSAVRRRTKPPGGDPRPRPGSVYRRDTALRGATKRHTDAKHRSSGKRSNPAAEKIILRTSAGRSGAEFNPGNQPTHSRGLRTSAFLYLLCSLVSVLALFAVKRL